MLSKLALPWKMVDMAICDLLFFLIRSASRSFGRSIARLFSRWDVLVVQIVWLVVRLFVCFYCFFTYYCLLSLSLFASSR